MEMGVRLVGLLLRLLYVLLYPVYWLSGRGRTASSTVPPHGDPVLVYSVTQLADSIRSGELTSTEVVSAYIERVKVVNRYLNAVVDERFEAALQEARLVDCDMTRHRAEGTLAAHAHCKPLWGVPFTVKESCQLEGMSNSVGCLESGGSRAASDGEAVRLVRDAGAIPLLVSNTPELCLGWETTNLLNGTTNNPYCLHRTPGGSSGGEGALVSSAASPFGVASDIAGSIRVPAAFCGVFGHKPTPGIISISGHIPSLSDENYPRFLTVGPMCRRAGDLPLLLRVMSGARAPLLRLDERVDLALLTVHYMTEATNSISLWDTDPAIKQGIVDATRYLHEHCGAAISEKKFLGLEDSVEISISVFFSMKDIPNMLADPANPKRDKSIVMELVKSMFGGASRSLQGLGFTLIDKTQLFIPTSRRQHYQHKAKLLKDELVSTLGTSGVLLYPVFNGLAHRHNEVFPRASGVMYTMVFNILGLPCCAVPLGLHRGLPLAIQVVAAPYQDRLCLAVARSLEEGFGGWRPPPA